MVEVEEDNYFLFLLRVFGSKTYRHIWMPTSDLKYACRTSVCQIEQRHGVAGSQKKIIMINKLKLIGSITLPA